MSAIRHVALIGCGFTGTSAFFQLVDRYPVREISIFEKSGRFGPGYPYQPNECRSYLINNTTDTMCLVPSNRRAFLEWLRARNGPGAALDERGHQPRALFGEFLEEAFAATRMAAAIKGIKVNLIPFEVIDMSEDEAGTVLIGWSEGRICADMAILSTGRCPDFDPYQAARPSGGARYIRNHVGTNAFDDLPLDARVHVLGASLSAYDVVNRLFSAETGCRFERGADGELRFVAGRNRRQVFLCSRSGRLKKMQSRLPSPFDPCRFTMSALREIAAKGGLSLEVLARLIREEAEAQGAHIDGKELLEPYAHCDAREAANDRAGQVLAADIAAAKAGGAANFLVNFFAAAQMTIWDAFAERLLGAEQERRYRKEFETAVLSYAAPCPIETAERLLALHRARRLSVLPQVRAVSLSPDGSHYEIAHAFGNDRAENLINTTGSVDRRARSQRQPALVKTLVERGLMKPHRRDDTELDGAAVDMTTFRSLGSRNIYVANMLLWGPGFFTSSAFLMASIVERLLRGAFMQAHTLSERIIPTPTLSKDAPESIRQTVEAV
ncbi:MAG: FAD/NAD(P)-binding protein [Hyphomicrobiales bacterium]|nr:FAD/NAD(P)-binding protein [Hyphomicrobiales bacterium]